MSIAGVEEQSLGLPDAVAEPVRPTGQNERQHILESAGYWFKAARQAQKKGLMVDALVGMENAYNHVENALAATTDFIEAYFIRGVLRFPDGKTYREYAKELLSRTGGRSLAVGVSPKDSPVGSTATGVKEQKHVFEDGECNVCGVEQSLLTPATPCIPSRVKTVSEPKELEEEKQ